MLDKQQDFSSKTCRNDTVNGRLMPQQTPIMSSVVAQDGLRPIEETLTPDKH